MKVIIADDSALLREGIAGLLERQGHLVLAQAATAAELLTVVEETIKRGELPDVIITDVRMPPAMADDGLEAALQIRRNHPQIGILVVSQYVAAAYAAELFGGGVVDMAPAGVQASSGGLGYLLKDRIARVADFLLSLNTVAAGGVVIDPEVAARLIQGRRSATAFLSPREREVLQLMSEGLSNTQIGNRLHLSDGAVSKHVANVFTKLDLPTGEENRRVRAVLTYLTQK